MHGVWLQIAAFRPFVPRIDREDLWHARSGIEERFCSRQRIPEGGRGVAAERGRERVAGIDEDVRLHGARAGIPTHRHVREVGQVEGLHRPPPVINCSMHHLGVGGLREGRHVHVVDPDVRRDAVEAERLEQPLRIFHRRFARQDRQIPRHVVQVQIGEARRLDLRPERGERVRRRLDPAQPLDQRVQLVDREVGAAVDQPVRRVLEIALDHEVGDHIETGTADRAGVKQGRALDRAAQFGRVDIHPVVVGPHQRELHAVVVGRAEEAFVQPALEEGAVVVVIPIEQEDVDSVVGGRGDIACHGLRVGFILVAPDRHAWLAMAGEARLGALDQLPLGPARAVRGLVARVDVVVREIVAGDGVVFGHDFLFSMETSFDCGPNTTQPSAQGAPTRKG